MKLSQLALFLDTCEAGSITEAAKRCGKNRTTVSSALSALEDELGVSLLERSGNQVQLTEIGESIRSDAERIIMIANDIHAKCHQHLEGVESALRIARDDALPEAFWRQLVHDLSVKFPNSSISIYVAPPPELDEMVEQNMVDMAFCLLPTTDNLPNNQYALLGQIRMMSVARADHPINQLSEVLGDDLAMQRNLYWLRSKTKPSRLCHRHPVTISPSPSMNTCAMPSSMVMAGPPFHPYSSTVTCAMAQ